MAHNCKHSCGHFVWWLVWDISTLLLLSSHTSVGAHFWISLLRQLQRFSPSKRLQQQSTKGIIPPTPQPRRPTYLGLWLSDRRLRSRSFHKGKVNRQ